MAFVTWLSTLKSEEDMIPKNKNTYSSIRKILITLPIFGFFLLLCHAGYASELDFAWGPPAQTDSSRIGGYYVYWGNESRNYAARTHLGDVNETTIKELIEGNTYFFAVTCYYKGSPEEESGFSNEAIKTVN